jgi:hypothetical protein
MLGQSFSASATLLGLLDHPDHTVLIERPPSRAARSAALSVGSVGQAPGVTDRRSGELGVREVSELELGWPGP